MQLIPDWRPIPDWKRAWRFLSMQIAAIGALLMGLLLAFPDLWAAMPAEVRTILPARWQAFVPMILFAATMLARVKQQAPATAAAPAALGLFAAAAPTWDRVRLEAELVRDEGERLRVYRCTAGKLTIGVGRNLDDNPITPAEAALIGVTQAKAIAKGITRTQSRQLLAIDIGGCAADLDRTLPWWRKLSDVRQRVLLNMCFNLGIHGLCSFRNTLGAVASARWSDAAAGMRGSLWARQVGARAERLAQMMITG